MGLVRNAASRQIVPLDAAAQEIEVVGDLIWQIDVSNKAQSVKNHQSVASTFFWSAA
jgi:hypothetical protein